MLRTAATAMFCTVMFAAGAQAATKQITASGETISADGVFASGGAYELPVGSSVAFDLTSRAPIPTYDAILGAYVDASVGVGGGSIIASFGGVVVLDITAAPSRTILRNDFVISATMSAESGGLIAAGTFDLIVMGVEKPLPGANFPHMTSSLVLFAPDDAFETWTSFDDLPFSTMSRFIEFYSRTYDVDPATGAVTLVESDGLATASALSISVAPVPLPAAAPLLVAGIVGLGFAGRRRIKA